jgi:formate dehydrogenase major subunit
VSVIATKAEPQARDDTVLITVNGQPAEVPAHATILQALRAAGITVPTLCHDDRLNPAGVCRLCLVEVEGHPHITPACCTPVHAGMVVRTHTEVIEETRRANLSLLAGNYPNAAVTAAPDKQLHHWLQHYGITPGGENHATPDAERFRDSTHPYIHVDMTQCIDCLRCVRICAEVQGQFVWHAIGRGAGTCIVPDKGRTLLESSCVSCGACVDTCPTGALEDQSVLAHGHPNHWTRTTCPYCGVGCEMLVGTRDHRIVQVKPAPDAPVNKGHLCVKGRYAFDFTHSTDRITEPMIRREGGWQKVSWAEAIKFVATRLQDIRSQHGPDSIGVLGSARGTNEENYLAQKFARVVLGTNNVDCCARVCHAPTAAAMKAMLGTGAATNSFDDIERAHAFLLCGTNATENHPVVGARIRQAVLRGAKLVVIDPREIELARQATIHLQLRPGTNVPLLNAMACTLVEEQLFDEAAVGARIAGWDEFREFIRDFTPERMAEICGVDAPLIREAARVYAAGKPAMCFHGLGMTEHVQGTEGVMCLVNLALLTGNFGKPGSGVNPLRGQNNVQGSAHMGCEPGNLTGFVSLDEGRTLFEETWHAPLPRTRGLNLMQMLDSAAQGSLKALWAIGYDVALTNPNALATARSLKSLEFVIVQDLFLNELARECGSVFLPASSSFEKDGTFMNSERRVQRIRKAVEPPGAARSDWEIICDVAHAMGHEAQFTFGSAESIWEEIRTVWKAGHGITYARLENAGLQWPCPEITHPGTTVLHTSAFPHGARAPLKRVAFTNSDETCSDEYPFLLTTGRTLYQFNAGTMTMRTRNAELRPADTLDMSPADAARLGLNEGERVRVSSRHGETELPLHVDDRIKAGELFATFHTTHANLNRVTGQARDTVVQTPEYKVTAAAVQRLGGQGTNPCPAQ